MKTVVLCAYKGGTGKSSIARGLATTLSFYRTESGLPLVPIVILADILGQSDHAKALLGQIFPDEKSSARYMKGRGFYLTLRARAPFFIRGALSSGSVKQEQLVLIADTGAQLVLDAAKSYSTADAFVIPYNRSDLSDGVPKLIDTLAHLQKTQGLEAKGDSTILQKTHIVLNQLHPDPERRRHQLEKPDFKALLSNPAISSRIMKNGILSMQSVADNADLSTVPSPHGLKHVVRNFAPFTQELIDKAGWTGLAADLPASGSETRKILAEETRDAILSD